MPGFKTVSMGVVAYALLASGVASAQVIGPFTWQLQPHCNRIVVTVVQGPASYTLSGFDDLCGAPRRAPLDGTAVVNPDGTVQLGFTVHAPAAEPVVVSANLSLASLSGTWSDDTGGSGTLVRDGTGGVESRPTRRAGTRVAHAWVRRSGPEFGFVHGFSTVSRAQTGIYCLTPRLPAGLSIADVYAHVAVDGGESSGPDVFISADLASASCPAGDVSVRTVTLLGNPVTGVQGTNLESFFVTLYRR